MAAKTDFTPDEWKLLLQSPLVAGIAVSAADPSGLIGMMKESMASARALLAAASDPNADALVKAVAADFETSEGRGARPGRRQGDDRRRQQAGRHRRQGDRVAEKPPRRCSTPRAAPTPFRSRPGSPASPRRSRKRRPRAAFSASAARR